MSPLLNNNKNQWMIGQQSREGEKVFCLGNICPDISAIKKYPRLSKTMLAWTLAFIQNSRPSPILIWISSPSCSAPCLFGITQKYLTEKYIRSVWMVSGSAYYAPLIKHNCNREGVQNEFVF